MASLRLCIALLMVGLFLALNHVEGQLELPDRGGCAFYAFMSGPENTTHQQTIVFDSPITNVGGNYNHRTGVFTSPAYGVYVFSWTLYCERGGYFSSEIIANSNPIGAAFCSGFTTRDVSHQSGVVVKELFPGQEVFIRTHPTNGMYKGISSYHTYRSSFSGWKIF